MSAHCKSQTSRYKIYYHSLLLQTSPEAEVLVLVKFLAHAPLRLFPGKVTMLANYIQTEHEQNHLLLSVQTISHLIITSLDYFFYHIIEGKS
jgi:hypothetical protein